MQHRTATFIRFIADAAYSSPSGHGISSTPRRKSADLSIRVIHVKVAQIIATINRIEVTGNAGDLDATARLDDFARLIGARLCDADNGDAARIGAWLVVVLLVPRDRADALSGSLGRGRLLPRERMARERRDAPVPGFRSSPYAVTRMDRGWLPQVIRRELLSIEFLNESAIFATSVLTYSLARRVAGRPAAICCVDSIRI